MGQGSAKDQRVAAFLQHEISRAEAARAQYPAIDWSDEDNVKVHTYLYTLRNAVPFINSKRDAADLKSGLASPTAPSTSPRQSLSPRESPAGASSSKSMSRSSSFTQLFHISRKKSSSLTRSASLESLQTTLPSASTPGKTISRRHIVTFDAEALAGSSRDDKVLYLSCSCFNAPICARFVRARACLRACVCVRACVLMCLL
jgi:hypothetical protein